MGETKFHVKKLFASSKQCVNMVSLEPLKVKEAEKSNGNHGLSLPILCQCKKTQDLLVKTLHQRSPQPDERLKPPPS